MAGINDTEDSQEVGLEQCPSMWLGFLVLILSVLRQQGFDTSHIRGQSRSKAALILMLSLPSELVGSF